MYRFPGRALAVLVSLVAGLTAAFVVVPPRLAGGGLEDRDQIVAALRTAVVGYWRSGDRTYPPQLQHVVDYWFRFHMIKGGIAALLLIVLVALTVLLWRTFLQGGRGRVALGSAGAAVPMVALFALAVVMANIQGAIAPFASLLPMLMGGTSDASLDATLEQARQQLSESHRIKGYAPPALDAMVGDFARYHTALAVIAAIVAVALIGLSALFWRRFARADRRNRRVLAGFGVFTAMSAVIVAVVVVANAGTAGDPAPALLAFFNGGF